MRPIFPLSHIEHFTILIVCIMLKKPVIRCKALQVEKYQLIPFTEYVFLIANRVDLDEMSPFLWLKPE